LKNHICAWASFSFLPHSFFWHTGANFIENIQPQWSSLWSTVMPKYKFCDLCLHNDSNNSNILGRAVYCCHLMLICITTMPPSAANT
jgi:hypothetical protein